MYLTEPERRQLEMLRDKTPLDRFVMMTQLINGQFEAMKAGLKCKNPEMSDEELSQCFRMTMKKIYSLKR